MNKSNERLAADHIRAVKERVDQAVKEVMTWAVNCRPSSTTAADSCLHVAFGLLGAAASIVGTIDTGRQLTTEQTLDMSEKALAVWGMPKCP